MSRGENLSVWGGLYNVGTAHSVVADEICAYGQTVRPAVSKPMAATHTSACTNTVALKRR
jgi:hypothetical protein